MKVVSPRLCSVLEKEEDDSAELTNHCGEIIRECADFVSKPTSKSRLKNTVIVVSRIDSSILVSRLDWNHIESMGDVIRIRQRVPVTKSVIAKRVHQERERAFAHAQMMMVGAMLATSLMMVAVALLNLVN